MRPLLYLLMIGFMAYLVWAEDASHRSSSAKTAPSEESAVPERVTRPAVTAILSHGDSIYTGDEDGTIDLVVPGKPDASQRWVAHVGAVRDLTFRNERLTSVGADGSVATWSSGGIPERRDRLVGHHLNAAVKTQSDGIIVAADRGTVARIDLGNRWQMAGIHARAAFSVSLSPDEAQVVSGGADGMLRVWGVLQGDELHGWKAHKGWVTQTAWSAEALWSAGSDGRLRSWSPKGTPKLDLDASDKAVTALELETDRAVTGSESGDIRVFNAVSGAEVWRHKIKGAVMSLEIGPNRLYVGEEGGVVSIWDMTNGRPIGTLPSD